MTKPLKIRAETSEDLTIASSTLQDAILRVGEIQYDKKARSITFRVTRFKHESEDKTERVLSGLRIDSVLGLKSRGIDRSDPEAMAVLLAVEFQAGDTAPEGELHFTFAGGGEIRVHVECVDIMLSDMDAPRKTDKHPLHPDDSA